jgi:hypothetical protein
VSNRKKLKAVPQYRPPVVALRYNGWVCEKCRDGVASIDLHEGTTPGQIRCFATEGCDGVMNSLGYPEGEPPAEFPLVLQWYRPESLGETPVVMREYVKKGGLLRRAMKDAPDWVKVIA